MPPRLLAVLLAALVPFASAAETPKHRGRRARLKGLVFEAEDWTTPKDAWLKDKSAADKWTLWTTEEDVWSKRSMGASLRSPVTKADRKAPEDGAPPLHTRIAGIPPGVYAVFLSPSNRLMAYCLDGTSWKKTEPRYGETPLGLFKIADGTFQLWVDDRYANPGNIGSCYYDYVRLERADPPRFANFAVHRTIHGSTQVCWTTSSPVPIRRVTYGTGDTLDQSVDGGPDALRNHRATLRGVTPGARYRLRPVIGWASGAELNGPLFELVVPEPPVDGTAPARIQLTVAEPTKHPRRNWPVTSGIPFPRGTLWDADHCQILGPARGSVAAQFRTISRWPDGSVRWVLAEFLADTQPGRARRYTLVVHPDERPSRRRGIGLVGGFTKASRAAMNGRISFQFNANYPLQPLGTLGIKRQDERGRDRYEPVTRQEPSLVITDGEGRAYAAGSHYRPGVDWKRYRHTRFPAGHAFADELWRSPHTLFRQSGPFLGGDGRPRFRYDARFSIWKGHPGLHVRLSITNDDTSAPLAAIRRAALNVLLQPNWVAEAVIDGERCNALAVGRPARLLQADDRRSTLSDGGVVSRGDRARGWAVVRNGKTRLLIVVRDFWQRYPKSIEVRSDGIRIGLLPELAADQYAKHGDAMEQLRLLYWFKDGKYRLKRGVRTTADLLFWCDEGTRPPARVVAEHFQNPLFAVCEPAYYCKTGAFGRLEPAAEGAFPQYERFVAGLFDGLEATRRTNRSYGFLNYGDTFGERRYNWVNSEYDLAFGMLLQFVRSGELRYLWRADQQTRHVVDVDTANAEWDETRRRGPVYAHSVGHTGGFYPYGHPWFAKGSHGRPHSRAYMDGAFDPQGHAFAQGNLLMAMLMGEPDYLEAGLKLADYLARETTRRFDFGIERAAGWPLINVLAAYEVTADPYYLNAARIFLERIVELQDPATGGWRMRQGPPECDCPDAPHVGGKTFAVGILLRGLIQFDAQCPGPKVKRCIVRACDWLMHHAWNAERGGFRYKTGCPKYANGASLGIHAALVAEGLACASEISGDPKYRSFLLTWLPKVLRRRSGNGKAVAQYLHHPAYALPCLRRHGVTRLPE